MATATEIKVAHEKFQAGDKLSDNEVTFLLQHFLELKILLQPLGTIYRLAHNDTIHKHSRLADMYAARKLFKKVV